MWSINLMDVFLFKFCPVLDNDRLQSACEALLYETTVLRLWWVFLLLTLITASGASGGADMNFVSFWVVKKNHLLSVSHFFFIFHFLSAQAPKVVKVFINLPRSMGFDDAERSEATQTLELSEEDYKEDGLIPLRYVKFQNVQSVTVSVTNSTSETLLRLDLNALEMYFKKVVNEQQKRPWCKRQKCSSIYNRSKSCSWGEKLLEVYLWDGHQNCEL